MGKSTISMVIFNSYVTNYQRVHDGKWSSRSTSQKIRGVKRVNFLVHPGERSKEMGATVQDLIQETATIKGAQPIPASRLGAAGSWAGSYNT